MHIWKKLFASVLLAAVVGAGCGDGGTDTTAAAGGGEVTRLDSVGLEFLFEPDTWRVDAGAEVDVRFANEGSIAHEWILMREPIAQESEYSADNALIVVTAAPGTTGRGTFTAPAPGTYQVICSVAGHFVAGMAGELTVRS